MEPLIKDIDADASFLRQQILLCVENVFKIVAECCYNKLSPTCTFIISEIKDSTDNIWVQAKRRLAENKQKVPKTLSEILPAFAALYPEMYDVNIYVYKANRKETIIDIRYYSHKSLNPEYRELVKDNATMWHSKVLFPPYGKEGKLFDINWEHNKWRLFWWKWQLTFHLH